MMEAGPVRTGPAYVFEGSDRQPRRDCVAGFAYPSPSQGQSRDDPFGGRPHAPWVREADESYNVGPGPARESYTNVPAVVQAIQGCGAEAVHPGYGFLSENPDFAAACDATGVTFLGPAPEQIRLFGLKHTARELAARNGVP